MNWITKIRSRRSKQTKFGDVPEVVDTEPNGNRHDTPLICNFAKDEAGRHLALLFNQWHRQSSISAREHSTREEQALNIFCDHFNCLFETWQPSQPTTATEVDNLIPTPKSTAATKAHPYTLLYLVSRTVARLKENVLVKLVTQEEGNYDLGPQEYDLDAEEIEDNHLFSHRVTVTNLIHCAEILCRSLFNRLTLNSVFFCECLLNLGCYFARIYDSISPPLDRDPRNFTTQHGAASSNSSAQKPTKMSGFVRTRTSNRPDRRVLSQWLTHLITLSTRAISNFLCPSSSWTSFRLVPWHVPQLRQAYDHLPSNHNPKVNIIGGEWWSKRIPDSITGVMRDHSRSKRGLKPPHLQVGQLREFICTVLQAATRCTVRVTRSHANRSPKTAMPSPSSDEEKRVPPSVLLLFLTMDMLGSLLHTANKSQTGQDFSQCFVSEGGLGTLVYIAKHAPRWANGSRAGPLRDVGVALQMLTLMAVGPVVSTGVARKTGSDRSKARWQAQQLIVAETFRALFSANLDNINAQVCTYRDMHGLAEEDGLPPMLRRVTINFSRTFSSHPAAGLASNFSTSTSGQPPLRQQQDVLPSIDCEVLSSVDSSANRDTPSLLVPLELTFSIVAAIAGACVAGALKLNAWSPPSPQRNSKEKKQAKSNMTSHVLGHVIRTVNSLSGASVSVLMVFWARLLVIRLFQHICFCDPVVMFLKTLCNELIRVPLALTQSISHGSSAATAREHTNNNSGTNVSEGKFPDVASREKAGLKHKRRRSSSWRVIPLHPDGFVWKYNDSPSVSKTTAPFLRQNVRSIPRPSAPLIEHMMKHLSGPSTKEFEFVVRMRSLDLLRSIVVYLATTCPDYVPCSEVGALVKAALVTVPARAEGTFWLQERHHVDYCIQMWSLCALRDMLLSEDVDVMYSVAQALQASNTLPKLLGVITNLTPIPDMLVQSKRSHRLDLAVYPDHFTLGKFSTNQDNSFTSPRTSERQTLRGEEGLSPASEHSTAKKSSPKGQKVLRAYTSEAGRELIMSDCSSSSQVTMDDSAVKKVPSCRRPQLVICAPKVSETWPAHKPTELSVSVSAMQRNAPWRFALALARDRNTDEKPTQQLPGLQKGSLYALRGALLSILDVLLGSETRMRDFKNGCEHANIAMEMNARTNLTTPFTSEGLVCIQLLWIANTFPSADTLVRVLFKLVLDNSTRLFALNGLMHILAVTRPCRFLAFLRYQVTGAELSRTVCNMTTTRVVDQCLEIMHSKLKPPRTLDDKQFALDVLAAFRNFLRCPRKPERRRRQHLLISMSIFKNLLTVLTNEGEWCEDPEYHSIICRQVMLLVQMLIHRNSDAKAAFEEHIGYEQMLKVILRAEPQPSVTICTILEGTLYDPHLTWLRA